MAGEGDDDDSGEEMNDKREIVVRFFFEDTEEDILPELIVDSIIKDQYRDVTGFEVLSDTAQVDDSISQRL